jgi:hypothetical protein
MTASRFARCLLILVLLGPTPAAAVDGVLEINQACAAGPGCFSGDSPGLPVQINGSAGRSYQLTSDLTIPNADTTGVVIGAERISLNLAGFSIAGPNHCGGIPTTCDLAGTGNGVLVTPVFLEGNEVRGGVISGMGSGGVDLGSRGAARDLRVSHNGAHGIVVGPASRVSGNSVSWCHGRGIEAGEGSEVSTNSVSRNGQDGIAASSGTVRGNSVSSNAGAGIIASGGAVIGNSVESNGGVGISVFSGTLVQGNSLRSNVIGISLSADSAYRENVISNNSSATVTGGVNLGDNSCNGTTTCP